MVFFSSNSKKWGALCILFKLLKGRYLLFLIILICRVIFGFYFWTWSFSVVQAALNLVKLLPHLPWTHIQHGRISVDILYLQTYCKSVNKKYDHSNFKSYFIFNFVYVLCMGMYMYVSTGASEGHKKPLESLELELTSCFEFPSMGARN